MNLVTASVINAKLQLIQDLINIYKQYNISNVTKKRKLVTKIDCLLDRLMEEQFRLTKQEINDMQLEITRITRIAHLWVIEDAHTFNFTIRNEKLKNLYEEITSGLFCLTKYSEETDTHIKNSLKELNINVKTARIITEIERKQIVQAMGFKQGHWFKCPNGHIYAIGDCGGAVQVSKCNECGEKIGGTNHRRLPNNSLASEMDGASHAAWSDAANMANYQFDD